MMRSLSILFLLTLSLTVLAGGEPYWYFVPYQKDIDRALQELRNREFEAGRYNPVLFDLNFPVGPSSPRPGAKHRSIAEALEASGEDGTRSILDIERVSDKPAFSAACRLSKERLKKLYGTIYPTHEMVTKNMDFFNDIERGHCIFFIIYKNAKPSEILFAGYSFD